jgi:hypothetical protein
MQLTSLAKSLVVPLSTTSRWFRRSPFEVFILSRTLQSNGARNMKSAILRFAKSTPAVERGFIAAGLTVSIAAIIGTLLNLFGI